MLGGPSHLYIRMYVEGFFQDTDQKGEIAKYSDVMGGGGEVCSPGKFLAFRPHNVISEAIFGHLKQFLKTVHRSVC